MTKSLGSHHAILGVSASRNNGLELRSAQTGFCHAANSDDRCRCVLGRKGPTASQISPCRAATSRKPTRAEGLLRRGGNKRVSASGPTTANRSATVERPGRSIRAGLTDHPSIITRRPPSPIGLPIGSAVHLPHQTARTSAPRLRLRSSAYRPVTARSIHGFPPHHGTRIVGKPEATPL